MKWIKLFVILFFVCECYGMSYHELEDFYKFLKSTSRLDDKFIEDNKYDSDEENESDDPSEHAWEDSGKFEGDLVLNDKQRRVIVQDVAEGLSRNGLRDSTKKWPGNEVIYYIQREHFSSDQVQAIQSGLDDIEQASCVKFRPYKRGDRDAVVIQGSRRGCFSQVGYQSGYQVLNLSGKHPVGRGCFRHGTVVHELLHTLGFYHMQSSPDRDDFIDIVWENIIERAKHNFRKYNAFAVTDFGVGYDYDSVLHYSKRAFSVNGKDTIVPKKNGADIGQRTGLSEKDAQKLNKMYCDAGSSNYDADETVTQKPASKKKSRRKNKPFEGHGIGYHQGKTVVIKLPAATTYQLPDLPSYHVFDYFSKAPQALSPSLIEGVGIGKEITYLQEPPSSWIVEQYKKPAIIVELQNKTNDSEIIDENNLKNTNKIELIKKDESIKRNVDHNGKINLNETLSKEEKAKVFISGESENDLIDAFDRLGKIIKTHVYPSQTHDLDIYKVKTDFISGETLKSEPKQINVDNLSYTTFSPVKTELETSKFLDLKSPLEIINNIYNSNNKSITATGEHSYGKYNENEQSGPLDSLHMNSFVLDNTSTTKQDINTTPQYSSSFKHIIEQTESNSKNTIQKELRPYTFSNNNEYFPKKEELSQPVQLVKELLQNKELIQNKENSQDIKGNNYLFTKTDTLNPDNNWYGIDTMAKQNETSNNPNIDLRWTKINQNNSSESVVVDDNLELKKPDIVDDTTENLNSRKENSNADLDSKLISLNSYDMVPPIKELYEIPEDFVTKTKIERYVYSKETIDTDENIVPNSITATSIIDEVTKKEENNKVPTANDKEISVENSDEYRTFDQSMEDRLASILKGYTTFDEYNIGSPYRYYDSSEDLVDKSVNDHGKANDDSKEKPLMKEEFSPSTLKEYYKMFSLSEDW